MIDIEGGVYYKGRWYKGRRKQPYDLDTFHTVTAARNRKAKARRNSSRRLVTRLEELLASRDELVIGRTGRNMNTWIHATDEHGLRIVFAAETVASIMENRLPRGVEEHGPSTSVTFNDGRCVDIQMSFDTLFHIVTRAQGAES